MEIALHGHYGYRRLVVSSIPSILMMLVGSIYSVVDGLFVSNFVGTSAFAALNIIWPAVMLVGALGLLRHSVVLLLALGSLMTLVSELSAGPAARLFVGYDSELTALTKDAIRLYMLSFFISGINLFVSAWFTGLGNGKVSAAVAFIRNLVLELGFVFLLPLLLGPRGIWLAVDAADICCLGLGVTLILAYRKRYGY